MMDNIAGIASITMDSLLGELRVAEMCVRSQKGKRISNTFIYWEIFFKAVYRT